MGRPAEYSEERGDTICERLIGGESLVAICNDPAMPDRTTVYRWAAAHGDFASRMARAREGQADYYAHQVAEISVQSTPETAPADRVRLSALQWLASKLAPRRYGQRLELAGEVAVARVSAEPVDEDAWRRAHDLP